MRQVRAERERGECEEGRKAKGRGAPNEWGGWGEASGAESVERECGAEA